tara:strand:+ start:473 stop:715 length:243 start_codon:yes stop_codon:yes gene_type:complete
MNKQINLRLSDKLLNTASTYAKKNGFTTVQELIKETLREKLFSEAMISKKELMLVKKLVQATNEKGLWKSEDELFEALER